MGITSVEPDRTSALVLEILDAPQVVALARDSSDVRIVTVEAAAAAASWLGSLPTSPAYVVADARAVRALLADESGRSWLAALSALSVGLTVGEESGLLLEATTGLEALGLGVEHIEHVTTTVAVLFRPLAQEAGAHEAGADQPLTERLADAYVRAAAEANLASDAADRARRDEALALAQLRANIKRDPSQAGRLGAPRRPRGRWARAVRHPGIATRRVLGRIKRLLR